MPTRTGSATICAEATEPLLAATHGRAASIARGSRMNRYVPLKSGTCTLSSPFGHRGGGMHWGQDFAAADGTRIYAAQAGTIVHIGQAQGFGQWIVIDHPTEAGSGTTVYGHMWNAAATGLSLGDHIEAGQHIAYVGNNGESSGPHLHFEVHPTVWRAGSQIDPMPWLAGALEPETAEIPHPTLEVSPMTDTIYADVSEWQRPVDNSYPYRVICIRSNDGTHRDVKWSTNYEWCKRRCDEGALDFFIVYFVWRPNWQQAVATHKNLVGQPHPRMVVMIDVETWGGQIRGDQSAGINGAYADLANWLGNTQRVIGYGNRGDLDEMWPQKPDGLRLVVAGYGTNPAYPGKLAHQYTNGQGFGGGLPEGASPFGVCDMNSADGLSPTAFAAACGIQIGVAPEILAARPTLVPTAAGGFTEQDRQMLTAIYDILTKLNGGDAGGGRPPNGDGPRGGRGSGTVRSPAKAAKRGPAKATKRSPAKAAKR
jgi:hypothetical protein